MVVVMLSRNGVLDSPHSNGIAFEFILVVELYDFLTSIVAELHLD